MNSLLSSISQGSHNCSWYCYFEIKVQTGKPANWQSAAKVFPAQGKTLRLPAQGKTLRLPEDSKSAGRRPVFVVDKKNVEKKYKRQENVYDYWCYYGLNDVTLFSPSSM